MESMSLSALAAKHGAAETANGEFQFDKLSTALSVVKTFGRRVNVPASYQGREAIIFRRDNRLVLRLKRQNGEKLAGWHSTKRYLDRVVCELPQEKRTVDYVRSVVIGDRRYWFIQDSDNVWMMVSGWEAKLLIVAKERVSKTEAECILGELIDHPWYVVWIPFGHEYPGGKQWNRNAPQFKVQPKEGKHPTWDRVLRHLGSSLNESLGNLPWAKGIDGPLYLLLWLACCFRYPFEPLPVLFFFGPQNSGKSLFHEMVSFCLVTSGVVKADLALGGNTDKCGELEGGVIAYVEERDIAHAYSKLKDWSTAKTFWIRRMGVDAYEIPNSLHFCMMTNDRAYCPAVYGDTRITFIEVSDLEEQIPKSLLLPKLQEEAPYLLHTLLNVEIPEPIDRMRLPVVETHAKKQAIQDSLPELIAVLIDQCSDYTGSASGLAEYLEVMKGVKSKVAGQRVHQILRKYKHVLEKHGIVIEDAGFKDHTKQIAVRCNNDNHTSSNR